MSLNTQTRLMRPIIESELKRQVRRLSKRPTAPFHKMLTYHMGWTKRGASRKVRGGKRLRPALCLLACASVTERWREAVPGAAALELIHNFSLVHDDIQDNSPTRRGQATLWKKFGMPMAINAGDAFFTIANLAVIDLSYSFEPAVVVEAASILQEACLDLTRGQFLDLHHQQKRRLPVNGYWRMIEGKTAALLAAAAHMGALLGGESPTRCKQYRKFGRSLGLAFQVQDDILGIWGKEGKTGKSAATDLKEGKLSLPVVYGLSKRGKFARLWRVAASRGRNASKLRKLLEEEGALTYSQHQARRLTREAVKTLRLLHLRGEAGQALEELAMQLLARSG